MNGKSELPAQYNPQHVEKKWYEHWMEKRHFHAVVNPEKKPYTIVIPPPNVTGILTMGHVLNNTIQDILIRHARMKGYETLWIPGTDHAGIATQTVVEKHLRKEGLTRYDLGREKFLEKVWEWANKHKSIILNQLKQLGCSLDWERERFTLDEGLSQAVREVFVRLYKKGWIYRGKRIINWCPASQTALSDEEVIHREVKSHLWYFRYPFKEGKGFITVATTRPETMLGDTAVAVNPEDDRYQDLIGKKVILPILNREIPIIADSFVDPEFGTGAVKVTPAHDQNDFDMGVRHNLERIVVMSPDGRMNENAGSLVNGLDRFEARKKVVEEMERLGLVEKIEDYTHSVGFSERAGVMIEPYLSEQWFVRMKDLAEMGLRVVRERKIRFYPERWVKTYEHWMTNIKDWCISRQLWWGHRIPVFYCKECNWQDALREDPEECPSCGSRNIYQDDDVLDTWFSSWLWPFSTMDWPKDSPDLQYFYPTNDLVTAPDIIFFWVARMIMAGMEFIDEIPFRNVYFTGIIRDEKGRKMSKSLGNSPDPLDLIEEYGADALRFGIMLIAPQGQDILFSRERLETGRNFMNKIWNASRFLFMNIEREQLKKNSNPQKIPTLEIPDKWILSRYVHTIEEVNRNLNRYRFNDAAKAIYDFTWREFCDWYIEIIKERFYGDNPDRKNTAAATAVYVLKGILRLLHPYAPFITEEIWQYLKTDDEPDIIVSRWPRANKAFLDSQAESEMSVVMEVVTKIRTIRSEMNIPPSTRPDVWVRSKNEVLETLKSHQSIIKSLARLNNLNFGREFKRPEHSAIAVVREAEIFLPLKGLVDINREKERLQKELESVGNRLQAVRKKLSNKSFTSRAPQEIVAKEKEKEQTYLSNISKLKKQLDFLEN